MHRLLYCVAWGLCGWTVVNAAESETKAPQGSEIQWLEDYTQATQEAVAQRKMLFLFFHEPGKSSARTAFETRSLTGAVLRPFADRYVWAKVPTNAAIKLGGEDVRILGHAAFREMQNRQGIAIVDYQHAGRDYYGRVVSTFPFHPGTYYTTKPLTIILDLPAGTLTQRTMVYAVRRHPEAPASATGPMSHTLAGEAQSHSRHQANIGVQGHHNWDSRFHRINGKLSGLTAQEVVAESWPNEDLVTACIDCVDSWRQSSGHWSAVSGRHRMFGYDIKRGSNGIWYATGLFAR